MADVQIAVIDQQNTEVTVAVPGIQGIQGQTGDVAVAQDGTAGTPGIRFENDTDTGLYRVGANSLALSTAGTGRLFVQPDGSIQLPSCGLVFLGSGQIKANVDTGNISLVGGDSAGANIELYGGSHALNANLGVIDADELRIRAANGTSERLRITSAGLVGIGTSSPSVLLQSQQTSAGASVIGASVVNRSITAGTGVILDLTPSTAGPGVRGAQIEAVNTNGLNEISLALKTSSGGNPPATRLHITPAGNVGIGTTSPGQPLEVNGNIQGSNFLAPSAATYGVASNTRIGIVPTSVTNERIEFHVGASERARIDSSGRLLVGTSSSLPEQYSGQARIQTAGSGYYGFSTYQYSNDEIENVVSICKSRGASVGTHTVVQTNDKLGEIRFQGSDGTGFVSSAAIKVEVDGTPGANDMPGRLVFATTADGASSPTERMRITSAGLVGVGTSSPRDRLHVYGTCQATANLTDSGNRGFLRLSDSDASPDSGGGILFSNIQGDNANSIGFAAIKGLLEDGDYNTKGHLAFSVRNTTTATSLQEAMRITSAGRLLVGTSADSGGALLQVNGDRIRVATAKTPASATATGTTGEICWDTSYLYVCTATNTWKRAALSTW